LFPLPEDGTRADFWNNGQVPKKEGYFTKSYTILRAL